MFAILTAQLQRLRRNPITLIMMIVLTILFTVIMGANTAGKIVINTFHDGTINDAETAEWIELLNRSETFDFVYANEDKALKLVMEGKADLALKLLPGDYRIISAVTNENTATLSMYVRSVMEEELIIRQTVTHNSDAFRDRLAERLASPVLEIIASDAGTEGGFEYDARIQSLFGFALFFSIFTVSYSINNLLFEKRNRLWDRVILSPVSKSGMYGGHLIYSFLTGYLQIALVFALFRFGYGFPLGDSFTTILILTAVYTFAIVALGMMMAGLVRTPQQMSVLVPIVGVSFAMVGGAYWPIEIVTNPVLLAMSKIVPVTYGMEALKGVAYYGYTWSELMAPVSYMILFGVVCMGIGINLMERRTV